MNLLEALVDFGRANLTPSNDWYAWKPINPIYLPQGVVLPSGSQYSKNVALKLALSEFYSAGDENIRFNLTRYYIAVWGGVRGNKEETLRTYALSEPSVLIANGKKGIASWSKALCVRNPRAYAIYDARVALALNCLQKSYPIDTPILFPLLTGQNQAVNSGVQVMRRYAQNNYWNNIADQDFYHLYIENLTGAAVTLSVEIYTLEMLLFSKVLNLFAIAFPEPAQ